MRRSELTWFVMAFAVSILTWSCTVEVNRGCDDDDDCRYGRVCVDGLCSYTHGGARPTGGARQPADRPAVDSCQGEASASLGDQIVRPVSVTASNNPIRDCCEDISLRFHTDAAFGFDVRVWIGWFVGLSSQVVDLQAVPEGIDVMVCIDGPPGCEEADLSGSLEINLDEEEHAIGVSLCADVSQPSGPLDGAHLFVDDAFVAPWGWWDRFGVWLLEDPTITGTAAASQPLESLHLAGSPILELNGLDYYDTSSFEVGVVGGVNVVLNQLPEVGVQGIPFVITADGERILQGAFWTRVSSICPEGAAIYVEPPTDEQLILEWGCSSPLPDDPRLDPRLLEVLREAGKLAE